MVDKALISPCGLDCFNCGGYVENVSDEERAKEAERLGMSPDEVACRGCRAEQGCVRYGLDCETWKCIQKKGVSYCYECDEFPCGLLAPSSKGASYPHNMKVYNLGRMKLVGLDAWVEESADIRKRYYEGEFKVGQGPVLDDNDHAN